MNSRSHWSVNAFLFLPWWLLVLNTRASEELDYTKDIAPIFEQYCVKCHGPEKQKSGYRIDTYNALMSPGDSEEDPIRALYPMSSPLLEYLMLPKSDDYAMPPEDEDSPSGDEIIKIAHWIYQGAKSEDAARARLSIEELLGFEAFAAVQRLRSRGAMIQKRAQNDAALSIDIQNLATMMSESDIKDLESIAPSVAELNLTFLKASGFSWLKSFENLTYLNLSQTSVGDSDIPSLNNLANLEYLNLYGTSISSEGARELQVPFAGKLYLGNTKVTPRALQGIRNLNPERMIYGVPTLDEVNRITDEALSNSSNFNPIREVAPGEQVSETGIRHSFIVFGQITVLFDENSEALWVGPRGSRDGEVLPNGNILVSAANFAREYAKGSHEIVWSYRLDPRNTELGTVNRLSNGNTLIVERGKLPRLLEVNSEGIVVVEVPLQPETDNARMQTRMARKLSNGNYLVPHLLAFKVKEYNPQGEVLNVIATNLEELGGKADKNWPFTAIRLENGNTLVNLTNGNKTVEFAPDGSIAWRCDNSHVRGLFRDPCGGQRLENGNTVIASYRAKQPDQTKLFEVDFEGNVVWEFKHPEVRAHQVQILTTNGQPARKNLR
ncbi:MAG: c-type cytochrome domain-containing protein [Verrucomicrobiota bacterium]